MSDERLDAIRKHVAMVKDMAARFGEPDTAPDMLADDAAYLLAALAASQERVRGLTEAVEDCLTAWDMIDECTGSAVYDIPGAFERARARTGRRRRDA